MKAWNALPALLLSLPALAAEGEPTEKLTDISNAQMLMP